MKKKLFLYMFILIVSVMSFLTGCSSETQKQQENSVLKNENGKSKTKVEIAVWSTGYTKIIEPLISEYNETNNDNITIEVIKIAQDKYSEIMNMLMTSGEGPDVFGLNSGLTYSYVYKNWLVDLSKHIDNNFLKQFPDWAVNFARDPAYDGSFYTIPSTEITFRLIYNKDLFKMAGLNPDAPPKTLAQLKKFAKEIAEAGKGDRKYGFALPIGDEWVGFTQSMEMPNAYSGVYYYDFKEGKYDLSVYKPWFDTILGMKKDGSLFPGDSSLKKDSAMAQFAEGNIGMMYASSWDPSVLNYQFPAKCNWGVALPPAYDEYSAGKGAIPIYPGSCYAINARSGNLDQSLKVWKFLNSEKYLGRLYKNGVEIPVMENIINNPDFKPNMVNFEEFLPGSKDSPYPNTPKFINEWLRMDAYITSISGSAPLGTTLADETYRLNVELENAKNAKRSDKGIYKYPTFDPKKPAGN